MIHLQGMGLLGSLTAWQLYKRGIKFTWNDTEDSVNAWQACTGACYPASGDVDWSCYKQWRVWESRDIYPAGCLEKCAYWVDSVHKSLPHGLEAEVEAEVGGMRLVGTSVHVNAQRLVLATRGKFASCRQVRGVDSQLVVSHGFSIRRARYLWGWTRLIKLKLPTEILEHGRPSFYLRKNRFQFAYCYPQPGSDWHYAGSSLISQQVAKPLNIEAKYRAWRERFAELTQGCVRIVNEGKMLEGWRPAKAGSLSEQEGHKAEGGSLLLVERGTIYYPTLASNGFRHFPAVWRELADFLKLKNP